ncbi:MULTISPECIES: EpsG family protein [unclassified Vibrio]|uniref:EpsG family protein n=1 Tax=unclassified Vibrio TaxID=2614977 RepID=UPI00354C2490
MIILFIFTILVLALWTTTKFGADDLKLNFFVFIYTVVFGTFIIAFNFETPDYSSYIYIVNEVGSFDDYLSGSTEGLHGDFTFFFLSALSNSMGFEPWFVFGCIGLISISIVCFVVVKTSPVPALSIFIYLSHSFINKEMIQRRAGLATAFALLAIYYLSKNSKVRTTGSLSLMVLSHSSSIFSFAPIVMYKLVSKHKFRLLALVCLGLSVSFNVMGGFAFISQLFPSLVPQQVLMYSEWDKYNFEIGIFSPSVLRAVLISVLSIVYFHKIKDNAFLTLSFLFYIGATCFLITFSDLAILAARVSSILFCVECILVPFIMNCFSSKYGYFLAWLYGVLILSNNIILGGLGTVGIF